MDEVQGMNIDETFHHSIDTSYQNSRRSYDSADSGYLTFTSSFTNHTPVSEGGCRTRSCTSAKRHCRIRHDPWQSGRILRSHSKINRSRNGSESESYINESSDFGGHFGVSSSITQSKNQKTCGNQSTQSTHLPCQDFGIVLRSRNRRSCHTTTPVTPASTYSFISHPLSPAVPSSSFIASEPIEEDVEMKLVIVPQSTPETTTFSTQPQIPLITITYSPTSSKTSPVTITSAENQKLSQLKITDLNPSIDIKPKRLDFSRRIFSRHRTRATPDYTGSKTLDLLSLLGEKSNHWSTISKILSYLGPQDLCSISMVSKAWNRICANDPRANMRRLSYIILRQSAKENFKLTRRTKDLPATPKSRYAKKGFLLQVQNIMNVRVQQAVPQSPPVSPSKIKFHSFVKAGRSLAPTERLLHCPRCSFASHVNDEKNVGTCSRIGCLMEFCTLCSSKAHTGPCKTPLLATPTKRKNELVVGSKQSRRNLRRL